MTNYTVGSSIFCKLHLRVFDFLTFILQGPQFCKKYTLGLSKIGIVSYTLGLGVRLNILTPVTFYWKSPLGARVRLKTSFDDQPAISSFLEVHIVFFQVSL